MSTKDDKAQKEMLRIRSVIEDIDQTEKKFLSERDVWKERMQELTGMFKDINNIVSLQVELHRALHEALDYKSYIRGMIIKKNVIIRKLRGGTIRNTTTNSQIRYTATEKQQKMEGMLRVDLNHLEVLEMVSDYYEDLCRTLQGMTYQIQHRITLEDLSTDVR